MESDDFDWIRKVPNSIPFEHVIIGDKYRIETTEVFNQAIEACETIRLSRKPTTATVIDRDVNSRYDEVFCGSKRQDMAISLHLSFHHSNSFWVTDDMVKLYPLK